MVVVNAGDDKGQQGRVLKVLVDKQRAIVEGVNMVSKQTKPNAKEDELKGVDAVTDCQALAQAAGGCTDEVIVTNMSIADQNNAWYNRSKDGVSERTPPANNPASYIGVNRTDDLTDEKAITGILLYKLNDTVAPNKVEIDDIEYICAGAQVPIIMNGQKYYRYYTYN